MTQQLVATIYAFYVGTLAINIIVAGMQFAADRDRAKLLVGIYWVAILVSSLSNALFPDVGLAMMLVASIGTIVSQSLLGFVLGEVLGVRVDLRGPILFYGATALAGTGLERLGFPFEIYSGVVVVGGASPFVYAAWVALRRRSGPLSTVQKMFVATAVLMTVHYLDFPWFRERPQLFVVGSGVAFGLFHILSILMPMMVVEHELRQRNARLEDEVRRRARQLTSAEERLWEANKLASLGRMAGGVAHELNTPLSIIGLHADLIRADLAHDRLTPKSVATHVDGIHRVLERISRITEVLRRIAKESAGVRRTFDLRPLVEESLATHAGRMRDAGIELRPELAPGPWMVDGDSAELSQVVGHLLDNAVDAVKGLETRWIRIAGGPRENEVALVVEDSGRIPPELADRIMEPFFTTKPVGTASGLGLSISKATAENHGGTLQLDRDSDHTRFVLVLPGAGK